MQATRRHILKAIGAGGMTLACPAVLRAATKIELIVVHGSPAKHVITTGAGMVIADETLPPDVIEALARRGRVVEAKRSVFPYAFGVPAGVAREGGMNTGCTEIMTPWGDAISET